MYSIDHPASPHHGSTFLVCPFIRERNLQDIRKINDESYNIVESSYSSDEPPYAHRIRPLHGCNNKEGEPNGFKCRACKLTTIGSTYYFCDGCNKSYHKECVESPPEINVPSYHSKHPLQLSRYLLYTSDQCRMVSHCCGNLNKGLFYYCSICDFSMHPVCARKPTLFSIDHPKCHEHTLMYFHRKASLSCNLCGSDDERYFFYICHQCDFVVHKMCIYLPRVILVSRHNHRLSLTSSLPSGEWLCGVCHKKINESYGEYLCVKGCKFAIHSKCATQSDVWDGRDLEDEPEDEYEYTMAFEELYDGTIRYFSHLHHPLRLFEKIDGVYDENTYCQACTLRLYDENIYKCEHCNFNLHQTCAYLPLKKRHQSHKHPLILQADSGDFYKCNTCQCLFSGFVYACSQGCDFNINIRCSMVSEPFDHPCHPHPLFLGPTGPNGKCWTCSGYAESLYCIVCDFTACFHCATLPDKVRYKHDDDHFLMLSRVEHRDEKYWCEVCEKYIYTEGIYACNICSITLHIDCVVGDIYQKPGQSFESHEMKAEVLRNSSLTRPTCYNCRRRCKYRLLFQLFNYSDRAVMICSTSCLANL